MRFDVVDCFRSDAGRSQCQGDDRRLSFDARRGKTVLRRTVVVDCRSADYGVDLVAILDRLGEPLQKYDGRTRTEDSALGGRIESSAVAVRR